jgi:hypothetical protein
MSNWYQNSLVPVPKPPVGLDWYQPFTPRGGNKGARYQYQPSALVLVPVPSERGGEGKKEPAQKPRWPTTPLSHGWVMGPWLARLGGQHA